MLFRQFPRHFRLFTRSYAKDAAVETALKAVFKKMEKPVQEETLRYVNPFACIKIRSDVNVNIRSSDVHKYPNADALIVQMKGIIENNCPAKMHMDVSDNERLVDIVISKLTSSDIDIQCDIQVPLRAELHVESKESASVSNVYSNRVTIFAKKNIDVESVQSRSYSLCSEKGNIVSKGTLLGQTSKIETKKNGNIKLDKLQGDELHCSTEAGDIEVDSCYVEQSKFETKTGNMLLKNVHKKSEVHVHKEGKLNMSGVHGNLYVRSNGGSINLQLSELQDENIIICDNMKDAQIYLSDDIEKNTYLEITSSPIILDQCLAHLANCLSTDQQTLEVGTQRNNQNKLLVAIKGGLKLGKLSWADNLMAKLSINDNNKK